MRGPGLKHFCRVREGDCQSIFSDDGQWTRMRSCATVLTALERRYDRRMLPYVTIKSVPGTDRVYDVGAATVPLWVAVQNEVSVV